MKERIKDRIAKLMAMATDGRGNPHEAEAAMRMAQALMRKHGIELIEIARRTGHRPQYNWCSGFCPVSIILPSLIIPTWFSYLAAGVAIFTDTLGKMTMQREQGWCAEFCGDEHDVSYAVWLCGHLRDEARRLSSAYAGTREQRGMFRKAFAVQMSARMQHIKKGAEEELRRTDASTSTALAINRVDKIKARTERFGPQVFSAAEEDWLGGPGAVAGTMAANRTGLDRPLETEG